MKIMKIICIHIQTYLTVRKKWKLIFTMLETFLCFFFFFFWGWHYDVFTYIQVDHTFHWSMFPRVLDFGLEISVICNSVTVLFLSMTFVCNNSLTLFWDLESASQRLEKTNKKPYISWWNITLIYIKGSRTFLRIHENIFFHNYKPFCPVLASLLI